MKLINDTLSSAGLFIPPLLKLINEYAWQSYLEHPPNLQMINKTLSGSMGLYLPPLLQLIHEYARGEHDLKQQCLKPLVDYSAMMPMTPRLLNAAVQATLDNRQSILFYGFNYDGDTVFLQDIITKKWNLKWVTRLNCSLNRKQRVVCSFWLPEEGCKWYDVHKDDMKDWKIFCLLGGLYDIFQDIDIALLRQCRRRLRIS